MTIRPRLVLVPEPFVPQVNAAGSIRQAVGKAGRVHVARPETIARIGRLRGNPDFGSIFSLE